MGVLLKLKSGEFLDKFIKKYDYKNYRFLLISEDIKTEDHKNVFPLKCLIPSTNAISEFVANGFSEKYVRKYMKQLQQPKNELLLATIVRMAVVEDRNVVLMCSDNENEFKFINILSDYIKDAYGIKVYSYKKYNKDPKKCEKIKVTKKFVKILDEQIKTLSKEVKSEESNNKKLIKHLKELSKGELKAYCKENSIGFKKDDSKKDLIKRILKVIR